MKFESPERIGELISINVILEVKNGSPRFISDELQYREFIDSKTGKRVIGYVLKQIDNSINAVTNRSPEFKIERGYFFTGDCFEYGTLITDDNGNTIFQGTKLNSGSTLSLDPICPPNGDYWA